MLAAIVRLGGSGTGGGERPEDALPECVTGDTKLRRCVESGWEDVPIADIKEGDEVMSMEPDGTFSAARVRALLNKGRQETYKLITNTGKHIRTTSTHPYFVLGKRPESELKNLYATFEVDQSNRLEDMGRDSAVSLVSTKPNYPVSVTVKINKKTKLEIKKKFYAARPKSFGPEMLCNLIIYAIWTSGLKVGKLVIDKEYASYEKLISKYLYRYYPENSVCFRSIGHAAAAHKAAYGALKRQKALVKGALAKSGANLVFKESLAAELLFPGIPTGDSQSTRLLLPVLYQTPLSLSRGEMAEAKWTKTAYLKKGMWVATQDGWENITAVYKTGVVEQVYDIEIAGTHNFVGNGIVAHNTSFQQTGTGGGGTTRAQEENKMDEVDSDLILIIDALQNPSDLQTLSDEELHGLYIAVVNSFPPGFNPETDLRYLPAPLSKAYELVSTFDEKDEAFHQRLESIISTRGRGITEEERRQRYGLQAREVQLVLGEVGINSIIDHNKVHSPIYVQSVSFGEVPGTVIWGSITSEHERQQIQEKFKGSLRRMALTDPDMLDAIKQKGLVVAVFYPWDFYPKKRSCALGHIQTEQPTIVLEYADEPTIAHELAHVGVIATQGIYLVSRDLQEMEALRLGRDYLDVSDFYSDEASISPKDMLIHRRCLGDIRRVFARYLDNPTLVSLPTNHNEFVYAAHLLDVELSPDVEVDDFSYHFGAGYALAIEETYGREGVKQVAYTDAQMSKQIYNEEIDRMNERIDADPAAKKAQKEGQWNNNILKRYVEEFDARVPTLLIEQALINGLHITQQEAQKIMQRAGEITMKRTYILAGGRRPILGNVFRINGTYELLEKDEVSKTEKDLKGTPDRIVSTKRFSLDDITNAAGGQAMDVFIDPVNGLPYRTPRISDQLPDYFVIPEDYIVKHAVQAAPQENPTITTEEFFTTLTYAIEDIFKDVMTGIDNMGSREGAVLDFGTVDIAPDQQSGIKNLHMDINVDRLGRGYLADIGYSPLIELTLNGYIKPETVRERVKKALLSDHDLKETNGPKGVISVSHGSWRFHAYIHQTGATLYMGLQSDNPFDSKPLSGKDKYEKMGNFLNTMTYFLRWSQQAVGVLQNVDSQSVPDEGFSVPL